MSSSIRGECRLAGTREAGCIGEEKLVEAGEGVAEEEAERADEGLEAGMLRRGGGNGGGESGGA
jgi:hypothetical protein